MLSRAVKRAVSDSGLSVREAARKVGVGHETVYRWMRGEILPPIDKLDRLASELGQPITLELGAHEKAAPPEWAERLADEAARKAIAELVPVEVLRSLPTLIARLEELQPPSGEASAGRSSESDRGATARRRPGVE